MKPPVVALRYVSPLAERLTPCMAVLLSVVGCLMFGGCGADYDVAPVSGKITRNGEPLDKVYVSFQPIAKGEKQINPGPGSFAATDAQGHYELELGSEEAGVKGAVVGEHVVRLTRITDPNVGKNSDSDFAPVDTTIPVTFQNGVPYTVAPDGTNAADFDVAKPPPQSPAQPL